MDPAQDRTFNTVRIRDHQGCEINEFTCSCWVFFFSPRRIIRIRPKFVLPIGFRLRYTLKRLIAGTHPQQRYYNRTIEADLEEEEYQ